MATFSWSRNLTGSPVPFTTPRRLMMLSEKGGWGLVALDVPVDTTTPVGRAMAQILQRFCRTGTAVDRRADQGGAGG